MSAAPSPQASATEREIARLAPALGLTAADVDVRLDGEAERRLAPRGATGLVDGGLVYLRPSTFDVRTPHGRYVLAHELAHLAQARTPPGGGLGASARATAESEAARIGEAHAKGAPVARPIHALGPGPAADIDVVASEASRERGPAAPMRTTMSVRIDHLLLTPEPGARWVAGIKKGVQMVAALLWHLVGDAGYGPELAGALYGWLSGTGGVRVRGLPDEEAVDEQAPRLRLSQPIPADAIAWLQRRGKPEIILPQKQIEAIVAGGDAENAWRSLQKRLRPWYTSRIFARMMMHRRGLVQGYGDAARRLAELGGDEAQADVEKAQESLLRAAEASAAVLDAIREDRRLAGTPMYRALWRIPPAGPRAPDGAPDPASERAVPDERLAVELLRDIEGSPELAAEALKPEGHASRKRLLDDLAFRVMVRDADAKDGARLGDALARSTMPPLPASLVSSPALDAQHFEIPERSEVALAMHVYPSNPWELFQSYHYTWQLLQIPEDALSSSGASAPSGEAGIVDSGWTATLEQQAARAGRYGAADIRRAIDGMALTYGPAGVGATGLIAANALLRMAGTVIRSSVGALAQRGWETTMPLGAAGFYVVRCIATPISAKGAAVERAPSVAWLPVWVRSAEAISRRHVDAALTSTRLGEERLRSLHEELFEPTRSLSPAEQVKLLSEYEDLRSVLHGDAGTVLYRERAALDRRLTDLEAKAPDSAGIPGEERAIRARIADIDEILRRRESRLRSFEQEDSGATGHGLPVRLSATFIPDEPPTPLQLLLEAVPRPTRDGVFVYTVLDATRVKSTGIDMTGEGATREDAIIAAVRALLESKDGYGRGVCAVHIPPEISATPSAPRAAAGAGTTRTIEIKEQDALALGLETAENVSLALSVALVAAAPFLPAAGALVFMVPVSVVGAVPSAYRLAERASLGTMRVDDLGLWMDIVNVLSAPLTTLRTAGALRLVRFSTRTGPALLIAGFGADGLGTALTAVDTYAQIDAVSNDGSLTMAQRRARIMGILGAQLLSLGLTVGNELLIQGRRGAAGAPVVAPGKRAGAGAHSALHAATGLDVPIYEVKAFRGTPLGADDMIVVPEFDAYGLIEGIHVLVPEGASVSRSNIKGHAGTVELLWRYKGLAGRLRHVIDRAAATLGEAQDPADPRGKAFDTEGFYAAAEVRKLTGLVEQLRGEQALDDTAKRRHEESIRELENQIAYHTALLDSAEQGPRYVAVVSKQLIPEVRAIQKPLKERINQPLDKMINARERYEVMYTYKNALPNLRDNFEAISDPSQHAYNCFAHTVGVTSRNEGPVVHEGDNPFVELDILYNRQGYTLTQRANPLAPAVRLEKDKDGHSQPMDFSSGKRKIVVYGTISNGKITKFTHAAIQESDGMWTSKMGLGPLIRHRTVQALSGGAWGVPVAVYEK